MTNRATRRAAPKKAASTTVTQKLGDFGQATFCDELRYETSGRITALGMYPDRITLESFPGALRVSAFAKYDTKNLPPHEIPVRLVVNGEVAMGPGVAQIVAGQARFYFFNTQGGVVAIPAPGKMEWQIGVTRGKALTWRTIGVLEIGAVEGHAVH